MNEPAEITLKRKVGKVRRFFRWFFKPEPSLESMLRDFPRFKCRECGRTMGRMEDSPCSACVSRHINETDVDACKGTDDSSTEASPCRT